jgi:NNP family nitrate/nitrite transporter-like MFS transporter
MLSQEKAARIRLLSFSTPPMRAFHMAWMAFFLCFFAWFGIAPLMAIVREEMQLSRQQIGWCLIGSVAITIFSRVAVGWICDRLGPRLTFTWLLILGSLPVMGIALADNFATFLLFRVLIGAIGGAFVVTQYHMSVMFAPNCVGTANAATAGWGNLGGGVTQMAMPLVFAFFVTVLGLSDAASWRLAMVAAGVLCAAAGVAYYLLTQDTPTGNYRELRAAGKLPPSRSSQGAFLEACRDRRVWALFAIYGACFGIELTIHNVAVLYFVDYFAELKQMSPASAMTTAGLIAGLCGSMNLFARALGGMFGDRCGKRWGLSGRVKLLFLVLLAEGMSLMLFSQTTTLALAIPALIVFSLFVDMSCGATFAVVPFINRRALGSVTGIVGAGGNVGAVAAGFLFKYEGLDWSTALFLVGAMVTACSFLSFVVTFSSEAEVAARTSLAALSPEPPRAVELAGASA